MVRASERARLQWRRTQRLAGHLSQNDYGTDDNDDDDMDDDDNDGADGGNDDYDDE